MEEKIISYVRENITKKRALVLGFLLLLLFFAHLDDFIEKIVSNSTYRFATYIIISATWAFCWQYIRSYLPSNKKDNIGIIICIKTESNKQKIRIKNDFAGQLSKSISEENLGHLINIVLLNDHHAQRALRILEEYAKNANVETAVQDLKKFQKTIKGHFFIYGGIKERQDGENKYFLDLDAFVIHEPVKPSVQNEILIDMLRVWYKQISFQEKWEFKGFEFTTDSIFIAVRYVIGIAALVSGDVPLALNLHSNLYSDPNFNKLVQLLPNLAQVKEKLTVLLLEENYLMARIYYHQRNLDEAKISLNKSMIIKPTYAALLLLAIIEFLSEDDPRKALDTIYKSKTLAKNDLTWRYSEAFILMHLGSYEKALNLYRKISKTNNPSEERILAEVYQFNDEYVQSRPSEVQCYFIVGYLKYKKESNYANSYSYFEKFIVNSDPVKHSFLLHKANVYKSELEHKMKIWK